MQWGGNEAGSSDRNAAQRPEPIVGTSALIRKSLREVTRLALTDVPVLLVGETGTGKDLFARAIHAGSPGAARGFLRVNCASLTAANFETELFGANHAQAGRSLPSGAGTLFLDQIGDAPADVQVKLLRMLQDEDNQPLNSRQTGSCRIRIVAATHRLLANDVAGGVFRADLYYRLAGFVLRLPPLRERQGDVPALVRHFIAERARALNCTLHAPSAAVLAELERYPWPGNVRELRSAVASACALSNNGMLSLDDFGLRSRQASAAEPRGAEGSGTAGPSATLRDVERRHIETVVRERCGIIEGRHGAAVVLGVPPSTLRFRMRKHGIVPERFNEESARPIEQERPPRSQYSIRSVDSHTQE